MAMNPPENSHLFPFFKGPFKGKSVVFQRFIFQGFSLLVFLGGSLHPPQNVFFHPRVSHGSDRNDC